MGINKLIIGINDLATVYPELLDEWDYEKNDKLGIYPNKIVCSYNKKVWWICNKGHSWQAIVVNCVKGHGCPYCSGNKVLAGYNDLASRCPRLLTEWDYEKNDKLGIFPDKVTCGSEKKVWWKCKYGHSWQAYIVNRSKGHGCPKCGHVQVGKINSLPKKGQSFQDKHSELLKEWDYEKNDKLGIYPDKVAYSSGKKVWWKCGIGHSWKTSIGSRSGGTGCPFCASQKVLPGYNDLATLYPEIVSEWNYEKNGNLLPNQVTAKSNKKVWWICNKGHNWQARISNRIILGRGCPKCFADNQTSFAEQAILYFLDIYFIGKIENRYKFKDEKGFIEADIYLPNQNIVIEHDGMYWHKNKQEKDIDKECRFKTMGIRFIRIEEHNRNVVIDNCILYNCRNNYNENLSWAIQQLFKMLNIDNLFFDISLFRNKILEFSRKNEVKNSLAIVNPELASEWNYEKNGNIKPTMFTCGSHEKVWWKCSKGHNWQASIASRNKGVGCPYCSGKKVFVGYNDLASKYPEIAKQWHPTKNGDLQPDMFTWCSGKRVWWLCPVCGYEWQTIISNRTNKGTGCPECAKARRRKK